MESFKKFRLRMRKLGYGELENDGEDYQIFKLGERNYWIRFDEKMLQNYGSEELAQAKIANHKKAMKAMGYRLRSEIREEYLQQELLNNNGVAFLLGTAKTNLANLVMRGVIPRHQVVKGRKMWKTTEIAPLIGKIEFKELKDYYK